MLSNWKITPLASTLAHTQPPFFDCYLRSGGMFANRMSVPVHKHSLFKKRVILIPRVTQDPISEFSIKTSATLRLSMGHQSVIIPNAWGHKQVISLYVTVCQYVSRAYWWHICHIYIYIYQYIFHITFADLIYFLLQYWDDVLIDIRPLGIRE